MLDSSDFTADDAIPFTGGEGQVRLLRKVVAALGGPAEWHHELQVSISNLQRGFHALEPAFPNAIAWADSLGDLLEVQPQVSPSDTPPCALHPLALLLRTQPAVPTLHETSACWAVGALVFHTLMRGSSVSASFLDGLTQFFKSSASHWEDCRRRFQPGDRRLFPTRQGDRQVVTTFLCAVGVMEDAGIYLPAGLGDAAGSPSSVGVSIAHGDEWEEQQVTSSKEARPPTFFRSEPRFDLFEFQIIQEERQPPLGQFRLCNDPGQLNEEEHVEFWQNLLPQLRHELPARRLHVAVRFLSELCDLSLEVLAQAPLHHVREKSGSGTRRGSLHIDLRVGVVRRDFLTVAPRMDRDRARTHGRYMRTPIAPEILDVLRGVLADTPEARTVGDMLLAAGLTPTVCHALANQGRIQPRPFTDLRIGRSLSGFLLRRDFHPSVVSRMTGDITLVPRAHHYYLSLNQKRVYQAVNCLCSEIGLQPIADRPTYRRLGSPKYIPLEQVRGCILNLQQTVLRARNRITNRSSLEDLIEFHNWYACSLTLQIHWALGGRCQMLKTLTVAALLSSSEFVLISDRASDRYSSMRLCVITAVLRESLLCLAEHLRAMGNRLIRKAEKAAGEGLLALVGGGNLDACAVPMLYRNKDGELMLRLPTRADLKKVASLCGMPALNSPRHYLLSELVERGVDAVVLDAQVGHHLVAAAPFGMASGITPLALQVALVPVLTDVHKAMGIQPMVGLSSLQEERRKLPPVRLECEVELPQSTYLRQSVDVADFNPPDVLLAEEDCPWTWCTLAAHAELVRLRTAYLRTDLVTRLPAGAVLFCLAAFDGVFSVHKARWVFDACATRGVHRLGELHVVEQIDDAVAVQVMLHQFTSDALKQARTARDWEVAQHQLRELLSDMDPLWVHLDVEAVLQRLLALAAHAVHIEVAPLERFSLVHKAPFIPVNDLRRIAGMGSDRPSAEQRSGGPARRLGSQYGGIFALLDRWGNHDLQLGERTKRVKGALVDLGQLPASHSDFDECLVIGWVLRELQDPPLRRLSFSTLRAYLRMMLPFFEWTRVNERVPLDVGEWTEVRDQVFKRTVEPAPDQRDKEAVHRRWAWQHLAAFVAATGVPIPPQVLFRPLKSQVNYRPHLHAYVSGHELQKAMEQLPPACPTPRDWITCEMQLRRHALLRPQETRYLKASHLTASGRWLVVTTSGHDHLKNIFARGLLEVPGHLQMGLVQHMQRRRAALETGNPGAFVQSADEKFEAYDASQVAARRELRNVTGRLDLRLYDLRSCAITDLIAEPSAILMGLMKGEVRTPPTAAIGVMHARGAVAAREARHANVATTLRYYHLAGALGAREQINVALQPLMVSGKYLSAANEISRDAVYAAKSRGRPVNKRISQQGLAAMGAVAHERPLDNPGAETNYFERKVLLESRIHAGLLMLGGMPEASAADRASVELVNLQPVLEHVATVDAQMRLHRSMVAPRSVWSPLLPALARWGALHSGSIVGMLAKPGVLHLRRHTIAVGDAALLTTYGSLWGDLQAVGLVAVFHPSCDMKLSVRAQLEPRLIACGLQIGAAVTRERQGRLSFSLADSKNEGPAPTSGHVVGKTTSLFSHLVRLVIALGSK